MQFNWFHLIPSHLTKNKSYIILNVKVTSFAQKRQLEWNLRSSILELEFKASATTQDKPKQISVKFIDKIDEVKCLRCKGVLYGL